jgi:ECF transporter S component (folate family)
MQKSLKAYMKPQVITLMAMLIALQVVFSRFLVISLFPWLRISLGFLPIAAAGMLLGPILAAAAGGLGDVIGFFLFPSGSYFPGFTITAMVTGAIYGLFLSGQYKHFDFKSKSAWVRTLLAELVITLLCYIVLNTLWLAILQGKAYLAILPARLIKNIAQYPVNVLLILEVGTLLKRLPSSLRLPHA